MQAYLLGIMEETAACRPGGGGGGGGGGRQREREREREGGRENEREKEREKERECNVRILSKYRNYNTEIQQPSCVATDHISTHIT